ncbi:MAG: hypothetical protein CMD99_04855 [Gammaproteobacteria bacterium]|nr:hypothetical protein [Gammaproteobacteria bacterium]
MDLLPKYTRDFKILGISLAASSFMQYKDPLWLVSYNKSLIKGKGKEVFKSIKIFKEFSDGPE